MISEKDFSLIESEGESKVSSLLLSVSNTSLGWLLVKFPPPPTRDSIYGLVDAPGVEYNKD